MMELNVVLDFQCVRCDHAVRVTLTCSGAGLSDSSRTVASVNVPCPTCGRVNHLLFEPNGTVRAVQPYQAPRSEYQPSVN